MSSDAPSVTDVTGGSHGVTVARDHALALADVYDAAGDRMREWAQNAGRVMLDDDLLASALLSPVSFAAAEAAVLAATSGSDGILLASACWEADAVTIRVAVRAMQLTDELVAQWWEQLVVADLGSATSLLAAAYDDADPATTPVAVAVEGSRTPPADLASMLAHLSEVSTLSDPDHPELNGTVEVQTIHAADGVRHIVYLPGADDVVTAPWAQDADVRDLGTSLQLLSGSDNAYQQGVLDAMQQAGIKPGEPVALVGHSQGGLVAAAIASQGSPYSVTHVVTAGSPTAHLDGFPAGTHVLSLENDSDVVPHAEGQANPDSEEQVTVRFDDPAAGVLGAHDLDHYAQAATTIQAVDDASVQDQLSSLADAGFTGAADGQEVTSQVFQITRTP